MTETAPLPSTKAPQKFCPLLLPPLTAMVQELMQMLPPGGLAQASQALELLRQIDQSLAALELRSLIKLMRAMQGPLQDQNGDEAALCEKSGELLKRAASDALMFLQSMEAGAPASSQALFASYRELTKLSGKDTAHPADLWDTPWELTSLPAPVAVNALAPCGEVRSQIDQHVLGLLRTSDPSFCSALYQQSLGLAAHAQDGSTWLLAAAWLQALEYGLLDQDIYAKRQASRLLAYYTSYAKGQETAAANFVRDLLYFCAQAAQTAAQREQSLPTMLALVLQHCAPVVRSPTLSNQSLTADESIVDVAEHAPSSPAPMPSGLQSATAIQPAETLQGEQVSTPPTEPDLDFLQAAETLSEQLDSQLSNWLADENAVLAPDTAEHAAKLARLAWTAGCADIATLTYLLQRCVQRIKKDAPLQQRQTCHLAGEEINRLLHQFAAGFMRRAQPQVMDALHKLYAQLPKPAAIQAHTPAEVHGQT